VTVICELLGVPAVDRHRFRTWSVGAANRDPRAFPDPDRIDFTRERVPHIGFGHGVHHCLGAPLARMELEVAVRALVDRLPAIRLAVPEAQLPWKAGMFVRGPKALPLNW
jgi:cytochrome P450